VLDLGLEDASAFAFLEQLAEEPKLRDVRCSPTPGTDSTARRPGWPGSGSAPSRLKLLPSLDELRERITLHLSAAQPDQVPALISEPAADIHAAEARLRTPPETEGHEGRCTASASW